MDVESIEVKRHLQAPVDCEFVGNKLGKLSGVSLSNTLLEHFLGKQEIVVGFSLQAEIPSTCGCIKIVFFCSIFRLQYFISFKLFSI